ncbi:pre-mRNA-splicing factor 38 like protein [Babesia gibsoni]|uniref:Pre-mRNA-splicing factor 38 n=1 Tax=Babesia gibsoni TaxID=33632 RepID=A0AAD8UWP4_BABGI|nr:pre-mRNA-splicing factor 38 like protein [Babesia gibsoni]
MHGYNNQKTSYGGTYSQGFYPAGGAVPPPPPETGYTTHLGAGQGYPAPPYGYQGYYPYQAPEDYSAYNGGQDASANPDVAESTPVNDARAQLEAVQRCHMHTKPDLNCKFCRKYKSAVHELSRLAAQQDKNEQSEKPNQLPMTNSSTYNLNTLLRNNILNSEYYKSLAAMNSHMDVLNELVQYADHAEPYCSTATRAPSTLFCCLHKLFTLRLTEKQMVSLIDCNKSPYPRCCGFLYLRFVLPSDQLWDWFEPYFMDDEPFVVSVNPSRSTTIDE